MVPPIHLARDHDRSTVAALVRNGTWIRVRPGAYTDAHLLTGPDAPRLRALARIGAVASQLRSPAVVSHTSAALLWGLPTLRTPTTTHVIQDFRARSRAAPDVVRHRRALGPQDVVSLQGVRVTSLERTVVDCAMSEPVRGGVVVADAAFARGADQALCDRLVAAPAGRRGVARARVVLAHSDDGAESAGESLARIALLAVGLPPPETQVPVRTHLGTFWADLGWQEGRALAEYDGVGKYAGVAPDVVMEEKRREDALLDDGWRLLRLTKHDLTDLPTLAARVRRTFPALPLTPRPTLTL